MEQRTKFSNLFNESVDFRFFRRELLVQEPLKQLATAVKKFEVAGI